MNKFLILHMTMVLSIFSSTYCRAEVLDNTCLENPNLAMCNVIHLKNIAIAQESQVKHLRDISINLKEIAEQLTMIREKLEGVKK